VRAHLSLRARATLLGTLTFAVLLTIGSLLLVSTLEGRLTEGSDQLSRSRLDDLLTIVRTGDLPAILRNVDDNGIAQVVGPDGTVLAASPNVAGRPPIAHLLAGPQPRTRTFEAPDDDERETYRVWYASGPSPDGVVTAYVGDSLEAVSEASVALRRALWLGVPVVVALLGVVIWWLLGRAIGRLDRIRAEVDRISADNLEARVAGDGVDDEVGQLAATMNALLERLADASQRQRAFVADVSHDLQSPLAAQRVALEVALARPETVDVGPLCAEVLAATSDMERLVGDLLVVASLDAEARSQPALIDLDSLVLEEAARARTIGRADVDTSGVSAAPACANADDVRRVVRNLLDNAVAHARERVVVTVDDAAGRARLVVADDGPGVAPEQRDRIFDRFYRGEESRSRPGGGSGLGLSIARGLAERNGGRVDLLDTDSGAALQLLLPPPGATAFREPSAART
jgi:signal transduction histidine kinase